jgi:hypothetical protein
VRWDMFCMGTVPSPTRCRPRQDRIAILKKLLMAREKFIHLYKKLGRALQRRAGRLLGFISKPHIAAGRSRAERAARLADRHRRVAETNRVAEEAGGLVASDEKFVPTCLSQTRQSVAGGGLAERKLISGLTDAPKLVDGFKDRQ